MKLTKEDINILLQICNQTQIKVEQATVILSVMQKLRLMAGEIGEPVPEKK